MNSESTVCDDIWTTCCCTPFCVIAQMDRTEFDSHSLSDYCCISTNNMPTRSMVEPPDTPGESSLNSAHIHGGKWPTSIFCCFHKCVPVCLMAWCCPCFPLQRIQKSIDDPAVDTTPCFSSFVLDTCALNMLYPIWLVGITYSLILIFNSDYDNASVCGGLVLLFFMLFFGIFYIAGIRSDYRRVRGITENTCFFCKGCDGKGNPDDFCTSLWCCPCVIAQMDRTEFEYDGYSDCFEAFAEPPTL